jgi:putative phage-type endonuclease
MPRLSESELAHRRTGMGSTCIVEACGLAPWAGAGPMRLYCEKLGIAPPDDAEADDARQADREEWLEWGHVQEPVIADWYEQSRGVKLQLGGPVYSREHPHLWATLDRTVIGGNRLVEIKNVGSPQLYRHWDISSPDGVPLYVRAQVTIAMHFHGAPETDVVAAIGGRPPHVWAVFYDAELAELLVAGALKFWALVQARTPPALDATPATRAYLLDRYPANRERVMMGASLEAEAIATERITMATIAAQSDARKRQLDAQLMQLVGDSDGIVGAGWKFTWKLDKNGTRRGRFTGKGEE